MRPGLFVFLSGCLTFGIPLILAIRELLMLRRGRGGWQPPPAMPATPRKPLPPCLQVKLQPRPARQIAERPRELEVA